MEENLRAYEQQIPENVLARAVELSVPLMKQMGTDADLFEDANGGRMY